VQFEIAKQVLTAMGSFTSDSGRFANLWLTAEGDHLRLVAANGGMLALCQLKCGQGEEPLLTSLTLETGRELESMVLPARQLLPVLRDRDCKHVRIDQTDGEAVISVMMDTGPRVVLQPAHDAFFDYTAALNGLREDNLLSTSHLGLDPRMLSAVMTAGKRLGIDSPHHLVMAMSQTSDGRYPGAVGVTIANCEWFYCIVAPFKFDGLRASASMPPAWCFGDYDALDLGELDTAVRVALVQPSFTGEQLALNFAGSDPCADPDPLLKVHDVAGEELILSLSEMLSCSDVAHYLGQLSKYHLHTANALARERSMEFFDNSGFNVEALLNEEAAKRGIDLTVNDAPEEHDDEDGRDDELDNLPGDVPFERPECADCAAWDDGCQHDDGCIIGEGQAIEAELTGEAVDA
jgi:hypothetical protein